MFACTAWLRTHAVPLPAVRPAFAAGEVGDEEAAVSALRAGLDAGDNALDPASAGDAVVEFLVAPHLVGAGPASWRAAVLYSRVSTWRRSVLVVARP